jgi:hypothetical protein
MPTPRFGLPYIAQGQAQKEVTHNDALNQLDALVDLFLLDRNLSAPPGSPANGDTYLVAASPTGAWAGQAGKLAYSIDGAWRFYSPLKGLIAYVADEQIILIYTGSSWVDWATLLAFQNLPLLGVGTTADGTNPFSAKLNKALWTAKTVAEGGDGDLRYTLNKEADGNTVSFLFQKAFSGRAEFGLVGDNDFRLKVSPDGSTWYDALTVDRANGRLKPAQPLLARGRYMWWLPQGNGATVSLWGFAESATGTATSRTVATTNLFTSMCRLGYVSAATAGASAGTRHGLLQFWRGNAAGLGGFFYLARFGIAQFQTNLRAFVGLYGTATAIGNVNASTLLNMVGLAVDSGQTTWRMMTNDGSGTATATDLGANFPANTSASDIYELALWCAPNAGSINYRVERLNAGFVAEGVLSSDLPVNTALLAPQIWVNNGTTAAAVAIDAASQYLEVTY